MWKSYNKETRKEKASTQKLFLIETIPSTNELEKMYVVMGSSGNVYNVTVCSKPKCTCPDYLMRQKNCKHIFFILIKVMKVEDPDKDRFGKKQLRNMFSKIPKITANLIVNENLRKLYKLQNDDLSEEDHIESKHEKKEDEGEVSRKPIDDKCPICLDDLKEDENLDYCKYGCGKAIHFKCFKMYSKYNKQEKCVFCRADWIKEEIKFKENTSKRSYGVSKSNANQKWGYMNLLDIESDSQNIQLSRNRNNMYVTGDNNIRFNPQNTHYNEKFNSVEEDINEEEGLNKIIVNRKKRKNLDDEFIMKPKTAFTFYEEENLKKNRSKSIIRNRSKLREKWKKLGEVERLKFQKMAIDDKERYNRDKKGDFSNYNKNNNNNKRGRQIEIEKYKKNGNKIRDKKAKTKRRRSISDEDEEE